MTASRKNLSFAEQVAIDRRGDAYVYGGNWDPMHRTTGTDCSGCIVDMLDAAINGTAMEWTRHGLSTEAWRPPSMGGAADPANGPFGTVCVGSPNLLPADAAVWLAFHHGPGGGANSHTWCQVAPGSGGLKVETNGSAGTVVNNGADLNDRVLDVHTADGVNNQYGANSWWYLPGPIVEDGTPIPHQPSGLAAAPAGEPRDTVWADVSEFQKPLDASYFAATYTDAGTGPWKYRVICIRTNDGAHEDENFAANYAAATAAADRGDCVAILVYYYWRPGTAAVAKHMAMVNAAGGPHARMVSMIDLESGSGNPSSDVSNQVNADYSALAAWLGDQRRVIGYANVGDLRTMWQFHPAAVPMILAGYGSNPNDPGVFKVGHQYTDGQGYGGGLPEGAPPFGNCDMNSADGLSPSQLAAALGVGTTVVAVPPVVVPPAPPVVVPPVVAVPLQPPAVAKPADMAAQVSQIWDQLLLRWQVTQGMTAVEAIGSQLPAKSVATSSLRKAGPRKSSARKPAARKATTKGVTK